MIESSTVSSYEINRMYGNQRWKKRRYTKEEDEFIIEKVVEAKKNTSTGKACFGL